MAFTRIQNWYINHLAQPESERAFSTDKEFAETVMPDDGTETKSKTTKLRRWRENPEFMAEVERRRQQYASDEDYAMHMRREAAMDVMLKGAKSSSDPKEQRMYAKDLLAATKDVERPGQRVRFSDMTDHDLIAAAMGADVTIRGVSDEHLKQAAEMILGEACTQSSPSSASVQESQEEPSSTDTPSSTDGTPET